MFSTSSFHIIVFFVVWAVIWLPIAMLVARLIDWQPTQPLKTNQKLILLASLYVLAPPIVWWKINLQGLSFHDLGLAWQMSTAIHLGVGIIISLVGLATVFGLETVLGLVSWHRQRIILLWSLSLPTLMLCIGISFIEELVFRGYLINVLNTDYSYGIAAAISSIIFALLHLVWERNQTIPQLPGLWLMGMVLVEARVVNGGSLGLAWGLHSGWIWGISCLDSAELITYSEDKSWITGIYQQPLAGIGGIFCMLATGVALWFLHPLLISF